MAASSSSPSPQTPSTCFVEKTVSTYLAKKATGSHFFKVIGYSTIKGVGIGNYVQSGTFSVGGHEWAVRCYPDGYYRKKPHHNVYSTTSNSTHCDYIAFSLAHLSGDDDTRAIFDMNLLDQSGRPSEATKKSTDYTFSGKGSISTYWDSMTRSDFEKSEYLRNDYFTVLCDVTVVNLVNVPGNVHTRMLISISVPPSNLHEHLGQLLVSGSGADVSFKVGSETFAAHKIVVAARSPVFCAMLCGSMKEKTMQCIEIKDMEPAVFKALLHFIYNDSLPQDEELLSGGLKEASCAMAEHLLAAADQYGLERLKLICEDMLWKDIDVATAAATLALAEQHHCRQLKAACLDYIASPKRLNAVRATEGYKHLRKSCPTVMVELLEAVCGESLYAVL